MECECLIRSLMVRNESPAFTESHFQLFQFGQWNSSKMSRNIYNMIFFQLLHFSINVPLNSLEQVIGCKNEAILSSSDSFKIDSRARIALVWSSSSKNILTNFCTRRKLRTRVSANLKYCMLLMSYTWGRAARGWMRKKCWVSKLKVILTVNLDFLNVAFRVKTIRKNLDSPWELLSIALIYNKMAPSRLIFRDC